MRETSKRTRRALVCAGVLALIVAAAVAAAAHSGRSAIARHVMTPALGPHPKYAYIGNASASPDLTVFGCQRRTVGNNACYGPDQIRTAYSFKPLYAAGYDGTGKTVVIVDAYGSPTINTDLALFNAAFNLPAANFSVVTMPGTQPFDVNDGNQVGWSAETSLDVQWVHAVAPGAKIVLVVAATNNDADILAATQYAYDHNLGDVLSQSYGEAEQCMDPALLAAQNKLFNQMTAAGWTLFASAGDDGSDQPGCTANAPDFQAASSPASDPNVTGVGGTQLRATPIVISGGAITDFGGVYQSETTWNEGPGSAGGGGLSVVYKRTDYQAPVVKDSKARAVPDVAYNAAVDGGVIAFWGVPFGPGAAFRFGGTSAGSPQWAGLAAIIDQMAGGRVGSINKTLYKLGKLSQSTYYHDVADGSNNGAFSATPGFDEATGWGSPIASVIAPAIAKPGNG